MQFDNSPTVPHAGIHTVDTFAGFVVDVALPMDWEPVDTFDATGGARVWAWRNDPRVPDFCANAVLILQQVDAVLDPATVFGVLCEKQRQSVRACREMERHHATAVDGPGVAGTLVLQIDHEVGSIDSITYARILTTDQQTLIAQLTVTALDDSPIDRAHIRLSVATDRVAADAGAMRHQGGEPTSAPVGRR